MLHTHTRIYTILDTYNTISIICYIHIIHSYNMLHTHNMIYNYTRYIQYDIYNMLNTYNTLHIHNRISILYSIHTTRYTEIKYEALMPIALRTAILTRYVLSYRAGNRDKQRSSISNPYKSHFSIFSCFMLNTHNTISIIC